MIGCARRARAALLVTAAALLAAGSAAARPTSDHAQAAVARTPCFFISQWQGWKAPDDHTLYLGVNMRDVYRVDLSGGSPLLQDPDARLVSVSHGSDSVCDALDLQLSVSTFDGIGEGLIARHLSKLTPEQVAAIPKRFRPN